MALVKHVCVLDVIKVLLNHTCASKSSSDVIYMHICEQGIVIWSESSLVVVVVCRENDCTKEDSAGPTAEAEEGEDTFTKTPE